MHSKILCLLKLTGHPKYCLLTHSVVQGTQIIVLYPELQLLRLYLKGSSLLENTCKGTSDREFMNGPLSFLSLLGLPLIFRYCSLLLQAEKPS